MKREDRKQEILLNLSTLVFATLVAFSIFLFDTAHNTEESSYGRLIDAFWHSRLCILQNQIGTERSICVDCIQKANIEKQISENDLELASNYYRITLLFLFFSIISLISIYFRYKCVNKDIYSYKRIANLTFMLSFVPFIYSIIYLIITTILKFI